MNKILKVAKNRKVSLAVDKVKQSIHVLNLSSYTKPEVNESTRYDWVEYGDDNDYFSYLIGRYNGSPTNNAAINGIAEMIYGKGLEATDSTENSKDYEEMKSLFKKDVIKKISYDYKMMGQAALQIIYSKDRNKIVQVEHMPVETIRAEKANSEGEIEGYYYSSDWSEINSKSKPKRISAFGKSKDGIEILYIRPYRAGFYYYSPVDYQGGLQYAELEEEIANYHSSSSTAFGFNRTRYIERCASTIPIPFRRVNEEGNGFP